MVGDLSSIDVDAMLATPELQPRVTTAAILASRNTVVGEINTTLLNRFPGVEHRYFSVDKDVTEDETDGRQRATEFNADFLNRTEPPGLPSHELRVKVGAPYMVIRNVNG